MAEITTTFDEPYSTSTSSLPSTFSPSVVGIAGVPYLLDTVSGSYKREAFDVVQQRNTNDQRDVLLLPQDVWRQQAQSWHQGMGQTNLDRDDALIYRYNESFGINPWTRWECSLLPSTTLLPGTASLSGETWLTTTNGYLVAVNGKKSYWWDSMSASAAPIGSVTISPTYNIVDIANNGYTLTVLAADHYVWYLDSPTDVPAKWSNTSYTANATFIAWEKDYLLIGDGNVLKTCDKGASAETIYTHPDANFRWYSAAPGNSCIYVLGRIGDNTTIHRVNIKSDGSGLNPCIVAASLPDGETGYSIESYLGFVFIGTDKGIRVAQANNDAGDLTLGPIIPTANPVYCFEGQDRFMWYGNTAMNSAYAVSNATDPTFPDSCSGLGRMDLSVTTTSALTPAYANDICALTVPTGVVRSVRTFDNRRVFSIDGHGVWFETADLMEYAWLKQGTMSYGVEDVKTGLYSQMKWQPLDGKIGLDISYDSAAFRRVASFQIPSSIRSGNIGMNGTQFSRLESRFILWRSGSDAQAGPVLTRFELRSIPAKGRASRWTLPILNYEEIEIDTIKYTRDPLAVVEALISLVESGQLFTLQEAGRAYQVHGKDFTWQPEKLTINGRSWEGIFTLVVEEVA